MWPWLHGTSRFCNQTDFILAEIKSPMVKKARAKKRIAQNTDTVLLFFNLVRHFSPPDSLAEVPLRTLTNLTFWCGAGFAKSWDPDFPTGAQLFSCELPRMKYERLDALIGTLRGRATEEMSLARMKDIVYALEMFGQYNAILPRYLDSGWVEECKGELAAWVQDSFEQLVGLGYWDSKTQKFPGPKRGNPAQRDILRFFRHLSNLQTGARGIAEGLRFHFITTNYDFVIETILDNLVGAEDSYAIYTYRGFTPTTVNGSSALRATQMHHLTQQLLKLNGGFELVETSEGLEIDYRRRSAADRRKRRPVIIMPSRAQDYDTSYFRQLFEKAIRLLRESKVIVVVGYSLPEEDALLRFILRQFAEELEDAVGRFVIYVDPRDRSVSERAAQELFSYSGRLNLPKIAVYEGTFSAFVGDFLVLATSEP